MLNIFRHRSSIDSSQLNLDVDPPAPSTEWFSWKYCYVASQLYCRLTCSPQKVGWRVGAAVLASEVTAWSPFNLLSAAERSELWGNCRRIHSNGQFAINTILRTADNSTYEVSPTFSSRLENCKWKCAEFG